MSAAKGAIPAYDYQSIDAQIVEIGVCLFPALVLEELLAAGGLENGAATLDDIGDTPGVHGNDIVFDHAGIAAHDAKYLQSIINTSTNNGTDGCIHPRSIAAGGEYANFCDFAFHFGNQFL